MDNGQNFDGQNFFDQAIQSYLRTFNTIRNIATVQGDDCTTGCLLDYPNSKNIISQMQKI